MLPSRSCEAAAGLGLLCALAGFLVGAGVLLDVTQHLLQVQRAQQAADVVVSAVVVQQFATAGSDGREQAKRIAGSLGVRLEAITCSRQWAEPTDDGQSAEADAPTIVAVACDVVVSIQTAPRVGRLRTMRVVQARSAARMVDAWSTAAELREGS